MSDVPCDEESSVMHSMFYRVALVGAVAWGLAAGCSDARRPGSPWRLGPSALSADARGASTSGDTSRFRFDAACDDCLAIREISLGDYHACALSNAGEVYCWGDGDNGELGHGVEETSATPVRVEGISDAIDVTAGGAGRSCAVVADGSVRCWGRGREGQLGHGETSDQRTPVEVEFETSLQSP